MSTENKLGLNEVFRLQDEAAKRHLAQSELLRLAYGVISDAIDICAKSLMNAKFPAEKQTAIRRLGVDCLSHLIVSMRVGLWGALPESLSVHRGAIESAGQLLYVVKNQTYRTAVTEMRRKFDTVRYKTVFTELGNMGASMDKLHGRFSEMASHSTAMRSQFVQYEFDGTEYDRLGFAVESRFAEFVAYYSMLVVMMVCDALFLAHQQEERELALSQELLAVLGRFNTLCDRFSEEFPPLKHHKRGNDAAGGESKVKVV